MELPTASISCKHLTFPSYNVIIMAFAEKEAVIGKLNMDNKKRQRLF